MNSVRVPFPKYLNAKKLIYRWEYDLVLASVGFFILSMIVQVWLSIPLPISIIVSLLSAYKFMKFYEKRFKKIRKGYNTHFLYAKGYIEPIDKTKIKEPYEELLIPRGFENEFKD